MAAEAERLGLLGRRPDGRPYVFPFWAGPAALVDFSQPYARQWWADQHKELMAQGIDDWWTDLNEPEVHPLDMLHAGGPAAAVHNSFALQMAKSVALAHQVPLGLSMGMAGLPFWNTDIGGFNGPPPSPELYIRWMQFGAFTPMMRPHGAFQAREPWAFGPSAEEVVTGYIRLRYRLIPYSYTAAWEAHQFGLPLMRPLTLEFPGDEVAAGAADQYMWGRDLLVAPVLEAGAVSRRVYLPEGTWYDFWTNRTVRGGRWITAAAPLERMPLYVRAGAIIPMLPSDTVRSSEGWEELALAVYPGPEASAFELYEDDGASTAFQQGDYAKTVFGHADGVVSIGEPAGAYPVPAPRRYRLEVRSPRRPSGVMAGEVALQARRSLDSLERAGDGWYYDPRGRVLHVAGVGLGQVRLLF